MLGATCENHELIGFSGLFAMCKHTPMTRGDDFPILIDEAEHAAQLARPVIAETLAAAE
jgi:hypothetical protein